MVGRSFLIVLNFFLLFSCAQVGELTGGLKDTTAPKPIENLSVPLNGSTDYHGNSIEITFDEYVKIDNPQENIILVPPHTTVSASLHKKTLKLDWKDSLQANTTYTFYLNGVVKDITENNDSLMQFVFSTGSSIDSLRYETRVVDAFTGKPLVNCLLALYKQQADTVLPDYFARSDRNGIATINHLQKGTYQLLAFEDKNRDLRYQPTERLGFYDKKIQVDSSLTDSVPVRIFTPLEKAKLLSAHYTAPSYFEVEANRKLHFGTYRVNGKELEVDEYGFLSENKMYFLHNVKDSSIKEIDFSIENEWINDTLTVRVLEKEKKGKLKITNNLENGGLFFKDTLMLSLTDRIVSFDKEKVRIINKKDSSLRIINNSVIRGNKLFCFFSKEELKDAELIFDPKSIICEQQLLEDTLKIAFTIKEEKDFGAIVLNTEAFKTAIVVEVLNGEKTVRTIPLNKQSSFLIDHLEPGEYTFRVILDKNENGRWDTGDRSANFQPEEIQVYGEKTKVRANWEIDLKLLPKKNHE